LYAVDSERVQVPVGANKAVKLVLDAYPLSMRIKKENVRLDGSEQG